MSGGGRRLEENDKNRELRYAILRSITKTKV